MSNKVNFRFLTETAAGRMGETMVGSFKREGCSTVLYYNKEIYFYMEKMAAVLNIDIDVKLL